MVKEPVAPRLPLMSPIESLFLSLSILMILGDWREAREVVKSIKDLNPSQKVLDEYGEKEIEMATAAGALVFLSDNQIANGELTKREILEELGVSEEALDTGYTIGMQQKDW